MIRKIINIDESKCNGCGICVNACHENAIGIINGKAKLLRDDYCDGLGDCLPTCPTAAISFVEREAAAYDEKAVKENQLSKKSNGCPGIKSKTIKHNNFAEKTVKIESKLSQWPVQIKLVSPNSSCFENADLLIAADCTAYAYGNFHNEFMDKKITIIGCPKLDNCDYSDKLAQIIKNNNIKSITIVRMEVPCCTGIEKAVKDAVEKSGKDIVYKSFIVSINGELI